MTVYMICALYVLCEKPGDIICLRSFPQTQRHACRTRVWTRTILRSSLGNSTVLSCHIHSDIQTHAHCLRYSKVKKSINFFGCTSRVPTRQH